VAKLPDNTHAVPVPSPARFATPSGRHCCQFADEMADYGFPTAAQADEVWYNADGWGYTRFISGSKRVGVLARFQAALDARLGLCLATTHYLDNGQGNVCPRPNSS
jgi:hypothetical protein